MRTITLHHRLKKEKDHVYIPPSVEEKHISPSQPLFPIFYFNLTQMVKFHLINYMTTSKWAGRTNCCYQSKYYGAREAAANGGGAMSITGGCWCSLSG